MNDYNLKLQKRRHTVFIIISTNPVKGELSEKSAFDQFKKIHSL